MVTNVNIKTGIRYGVISGNSVPELLDEITTCGVNETYEAWKKEMISELVGALENFVNTYTREKVQVVAERLFDELELDYQEECDSYSYTDSSRNEYLLSYLGGAPLIWITKSDRIVRVKSLCSPCVPNAGDLDSGKCDDGYECYGVPSEWLPLLREDQ